MELLEGKSEYIMNNTNTITVSKIQNLIYTIRQNQVMLDVDLAEIYGVEIRVLNQAVKRNPARFPSSFMFQLTKDEENSLRSQIVTLKNTNHQGRGKHRKYLPYVFTEQGVAMLSAVLRSDTAINVSIQIMEAFVQLRRFILENGQLLQRMGKIEQKQIETDRKIDKIFTAIEERDITPKKGVFFDGQIFDAHVLVSKIIKGAKTSIIIIDNYIDETVLILLSKRKKGVSGTIYTRPLSKQLKLDLEKFNKQYEPITIKKSRNVHDRFLIIDNKKLYHVGASLKDLGKKWFAFSKMEFDTVKMLSKLQK